MTITLVHEAHSTTLDNEAGIATGWLPGELSEEGLRQAVALGQRRRDDGIDLLVTSDLARAVDTSWSHRAAEAEGGPREVSDPAQMRDGDRPRQDQRRTNLVQPHQMNGTH